MATILLSAAGAATGGLFSGGILGLSGGVIGRAAGATLGRVIDQRLLGAGSDPVERGRIDRFRITGASEGAPIAYLAGRMRLGGQVMWATRFVENTSTTGGGKGAPSQPKTTTYSYSISLAVALCEGEIRRVGRVWADGVELDQSNLAMRIYTGAADQMPDPLIEAIEGAGNVPAYRGIAYIVFEDLDLSPFGNRVPQFAAEVTRLPRVRHVAVPPTAPDSVRAVALMPGTGEYALATQTITFQAGFGATTVANISAEGGGTDFTRSLNYLHESASNTQSISLIYSWFGDDLRAGVCRVQPKVENSDRDGAEMPWRAGGIGRAEAGVLAQIDGRPVYGGTPADDSVIQAIHAIHESGQEVLFYPFLLMEILAGNGLSDPYGKPEQAALPWRGRITGDLAPDQPSTPDKTAANATAVQTFFGTTKATDFAVSPGAVAYFGPNEWSYSRFILHSAALCAAAGGVEAFCIGSEMRGLTQMRDTNGFPAVAQFKTLAAEVRTLLPDAKLSYAADWSEYFGYHPQDGSNDVYFHLDPLWADSNIDFIGIDNYMPLSDWRDDPDHADAAWRTIYNLDYLKANVEGGEGYDWYYPDQDARDAQNRIPITDGAGGAPWIYRYKDLRQWWSNVHVDRRGGADPGNVQQFGPEPFDGTFARGGSYWLNSYVHTEDTLTTAITVTDRHLDVTIVEVPDVGTVLQSDSYYRIMSERGWHPVITGQEISTTIRIRLLSEPDDGRPHLFYFWIAFIRADGGYGGFGQVQFWSGLTVADGWVDRTAVFTPASFLGRGSVPSDCKGWRLMIGLNGWQNPHPTGSVQQISSISMVQTSLPDTGPQEGQSDWVPMSKPIWFTEIGCAAIDKGTNQPNKFLDPKSSESKIPYYSNGRRDDLIQAQYVRAIMSYWNEPGRNPISPVYGAPMLNMDRAHVWAWDARPWPAFPNDLNRWSDGGNWKRGHWITGRLDAAPLDLVVAELCEAAGVLDYDVSALYGFVRGYLSGETESTRARLQSLMLAYGFQAIEREGRLVFLPPPLAAEAPIFAEFTALNEEGEGRITHIRDADAETTGHVRVTYSEAESVYEERVAEAALPNKNDPSVSASTLPIALTQAEAQTVAERWLTEVQAARDTIKFSLPPSQRALGVGSVVGLADGSTWRIDRVEDRSARAIEAVRVEPSVTLPADVVEDDTTPTPGFVPPVPVSAVFMDLPLLTEAEVEHAPHLAVTATPWQGSVAVYASATVDGFTLNRLVERGAIAGTLQTPLWAAKPGLWDRGASFSVRIAGGNLASAEQISVLNGANLAAIGPGDTGDWEVIQFANATLTRAHIWTIGHCLRGQQGTDAIMPEVWPEGSLFVLLNGAPVQVDVPSAARGLPRYWRIGPARYAVDNASYVQKITAFQGVGLRPYAPVHLRARAMGADRHITWVRRTRIDGDSWESLDVPLGEAREAYLLRITQGGTIKREETLNAPMFTYTAAMQAGDGVSPPYHIDVAQISERFGAGPFTRIDVKD